MQNVDPPNWATFGDWTIINTVFEGLVTFKPNTYEQVNQLAESFVPSSDGKSVAFKLKKGMQFHGGFGEVTAEDVKFSYERSAGLAPFPAPGEVGWGGLKEVVVHDKYSGTIVFSEYFAPIFSSGFQNYPGFVMSKNAVEKLGKRVATMPIGTGPYEFVNWTEGQSVTFKRFADYGGASSALLPGGKASWDGIDMLVIQDDNSAVVALNTGSLEFGQVALPSVQEFRANSAFDVVAVPTIDTWYLVMNVVNPKLRDIKVRQAIRAAVDVPEILKVAYLGLWSRANAMFAPRMPIGYWPDAPAYQRDPEQAKTLLHEAGAHGLSLQLDYSTDTQADLVAQVIQSNLGDVGINVTLNKIDSATYYVTGPTTAQRELSWAWWANPPDPFYYAASFTCNQTNEWNWAHWCDPAFDRLLTRASSEPDKRTRQGLYVEAQQRWDAGCSEVFVAFETNYFASKKGLTPSTTLAGNLLPQYFA
jgi:peptide/nickel transport system substrate-binding protein